MKTAYIIGGGLTGLTIANELKETHQVIIYEKNNYIGGTCRTFYDGKQMYGFGPHVAYWKKESEREWWSQFLEFSYKDYYVKLSIDGGLAPESLYDFPCSTDNIRRLFDFTNYDNMGKPDSLKEYFVKQVGYTSYMNFFEGYNRKQWGIDPDDMSADWCKHRPLTLRDKDKRMFQDLKAGFPIGGYNDMFLKLAEGCFVFELSEVESIYLNDDNRVNGITVLMPGQTSKERRHITVLEGDLVINTAALDSVMPAFRSEPMDWRGVMKVFYRHDGTRPPTYSTTFPNNYNFTRMCDYEHHNVGNTDNPGKTILSFAFPYDGNKEGGLEPFRITCIEQAGRARHELFPDHKCQGLDMDRIAAISEDKVYPVPTIMNNERFEKQLDYVSGIQNFWTAGRLGLYAYISMSNATEKARLLAHLIKSEHVSNKWKRVYYSKCRADLW